RLDLGAQRGRRLAVEVGGELGFVPRTGMVHVSIPPDGTVRPNVFGSAPLRVARRSQALLPSFVGRGETAQAVRQTLAPSMDPGLHLAEVGVHHVRDLVVREPL